MIFIKNNSGTNGTWAGQAINDQAYVVTDVASQARFANDATTLDDIGNGNLIVAHANDGTADLDSVSGLKTLLGTMPTRIANPFPDNEGNYSFRGLGGTASLTSGTNDVDQLISAARLINGAEVWTDSTNYGETVTFQVVDVDNVLGYGAGFVVEEFGTTWNLHPNQPTAAFPGYVAAIPASLYVRMKVVTSATCTLHYNLYLHKT